MSALLSRDLRPRARLPLLAGGMLALLAGVLAGLARLGCDVPAPAALQAGEHGALMVSAFFGTVIALERAVALGRGWAYLGPAAAGLGGVLLLAGLPAAPVRLLEAAGAAVLVAASAAVLRRLLAPFTVVLAGAAVCWLLGNLVWIVAGTAAATPWWLAFLVLTVAGERLELTRFLPTPAGARRVFFALAAALAAGAALTLPAAAAGLALFAAALAGLAVWLLRYDLARRNLHTRGLTRFVAVCLLSGYAWLAGAGLLGLAGAFVPGHAWRDAALHAVGLGFVFAMVFGHAPIVFPAVARIKLPYHPVFYLPLAALHASLLLRVAGVLGGSFALRQAGGLANALTLLLFVATVLGTALRGRRV